MVLARCLCRDRTAWGPPTHGRNCCVKTGLSEQSTPHGWDHLARKHIENNRPRLPRGDEVTLRGGLTKRDTRSHTADTPAPESATDCPMYSGACAASAKNSATPLREIFHSRTSPSADANGMSSLSSSVR